MSTAKRIVRGFFRRLIWGIGFIWPIQKTKILVSSYYGKGYGDNPKYVVEQLLKANTKCRIFWLINDKKEADSLPMQVKSVPAKSFRADFHMLTARIWLDNCRRNFTVKRKGQFYIQTWHGFALKRIEADVADHLSPNYVSNAQKDSKAIDLIVSEAAFMTQIYQRAFWYYGKVVEWGAPRNDIMIDESEQMRCREIICNYFGIESSTKLVVYAPTFRSNRSLKPYSIDSTRVKKACEQRFGGNFIFLVRLHPNIATRSNELPFMDGNIIDASAYPDMQELLAAADVVISDYSSLMFDFALSGKPCFQFATDIEEYKADRNFYFQLDTLPFSLGKDNDSLVQHIIEFDETCYAKKLEAFWDEVGMIRNGEASKKCAECIIKMCS